MTHSTSALIIAPPGRWRDSLQVLLRACDGITLAGQADDGPAGLQMIADRPPTVVVVDAKLPDGEAWWLLQQLQRQWPQVHSLVLAHSAHQERLARAAGADDVFQAGSSAEIFFDTIRDVVG